MPSLDTSFEPFALADQLNQTLRRLKQYRTESEWVTALLDGVCRFVDAAAVFGVDAGELRLRSSRNLQLPEKLSIPVKAARAFESVLESKDTVIALRTPGEVTAHLCAANESSSDVSERAILLPISNGTRVAAILFAVTPPKNPGPVLELLAGMASVVLERQVNATVNVQIAPAAPVPKSAAAAPAPAKALPYFAGFNEEQRRLHLRAKRFSRVKVAEMQLLYPDACRSGREQSNVYLFLKKEIDAARQSYRDQFMARPGMDDYLHLELVRIAADGDENKLGVDYPGHMG